ncbi:unnamed protein product [Ilex paraguariensis]|uniref:Uncharacterized protein n=1 Tax=Ilex paraguariensis TaxID=185542 RepID=A0ABC8UVK4_9AQUA
MASASTRKKLNKRSSPKPQQHYSSMSSSPSSSPLSSSPRLNYRKISLIVSVILIISVIILLNISWSMWINFGTKTSRNQLYFIEVINEFPHDPNAFTQGLLYGGNDTLFESTGLRKHSSVRKVELQTGKVEAIQKMDNVYFGEGLTLLGERFVMEELMISNASS